MVKKWFFNFLTPIAVAVLIAACGGGGGGAPPAPAGTTAFICGGGTVSSGLTMSAPGVVTATVVLTGDQEAPTPVSTGALGTGTVTVNLNTGAISGNITVDGTENPVTAAHIHQEAPGVAGLVIITLEQDAGNANQWNVPANATLNATQLQALQDGNLYFNAHTAAENPDGEVRGQIGREVYTAFLTVAQEVPAPTGATATGLGRLVLDPNTNAANATFTVTGLTDNATAAHIHQAEVGVAGPVIIPMAETSPGSGTFTVSETLTADQVTALRNGLLYFNVHTAMNGDGESRGQIGRSVRFAELDQSQEVPPTGSAATGTGFGILDSATRTLCGSMSGSGLTGAATNGAHIHIAATGVNGAIIVPLTVTQDGAGGGPFAASGSGTVTAEQTKAFLDGGTYLNIHTAMHTGGEIRGQLDIQ